MPTIDNKFIGKLDDFTRALGAIVELLQKDQDNKNVDNVNEMLSGMNDQIGKIAKNLEIVIKSTKKIESTTDKILAEVRAAKKEKEKGGIFQTISETENKKKIIDAVKVITLIASGILAIGLAVKMISPVDFLSSVAIGLSMIFIAGAFVMIASLTEGMTWKDAFEVSKIMGVMATALMVSSWALALSSTITFGKMMSAIFTASAVGISLVLIYQAVKKTNLDKKDYPKFLLLPLVMPLIALGIAVSSIILSTVVPMSFKQVLTTIFVATAIGASLYLVSKALEKIKLEKKLVGQFFLFAAIVPALATGLVISSLILSGIRPISIGQMVSAVFVALTIGILVYLMSPLINKLKEFTFKQVVLAGAMISIIAAGLVGASMLLSKMHFFSLKQSIQLIMTSFAIGLAVLFLTPAIYIFKKINQDDMILAAGNVVIVAGAISASSWLLSLGNYDNYPDWKWSLGVGISMLAFGAVMSVFANGFAISFKDFSFDVPALNRENIVTGLAGIIAVAGAIWITSWILSNGNYDEYPDYEWSFGVGLSLIIFGGSVLALGKLMSKDYKSMMYGAAATIGVAIVIMGVSWILSIGNYDTYPDYDWSLGVGLSLIAFGGSMMGLGYILKSSGGTAAIAMAIGALAMLGVSAVIVAVSWILSTGSYDEYPDVSWATGVGLTLITFGLSMSILSFLIINIFIGALSMGIIAQTIVSVSNILSNGDYTSGPSEDWANGVSKLIKEFSRVMIDTSFIPNRVLESCAIGLLIIANNIVAVSNILATGQYDKGPSSEWAIGTGMLLMSVGMTSIMMAMAYPFIYLGLEAMKSIAQGIVDVANILAKGNYESGPTEKWAKGVGLSISAFAEGLESLSKSDSIIGSIFGQSQRDKIVEVAKGMKEANDILSKGNWTTNYPTAGWSKGVGTSILTFSKALAALEKADVDYEDFIEAVEYICYGIMTAASILNEFDWTSIKNYPSLKWSEGVGKAINAFARPLARLAENDITGRDINKSIKRLANGMLDAAEILNDFKWDEAKYPSSEWSKGVGEAISTFVKYLIKIEKNDIGRGDIRILKKTISTMVSAAEDINENSEIWTLPVSFSKWTENVGKIIGSFVEFLIKIEKNNISNDGIRSLNRIVYSLIKIGRGISYDPKIWLSYPSSQWVDSISKSFDLFSKLPNITEDNIKQVDLIISSMIDTAKKLNDNSNVWGSYPPVDWINSISESIKLYADLASFINANDYVDPTLILNYMIDVAKKFNENKDIWTSYPKIEWVKATSESIKLYAELGTFINEYDYTDPTLIIDYMIDVAKKFNENKDIWVNYPKTEWIKSTSDSIKIYSEILSSLTDGYKDPNIIIGYMIDTAKKFNENKDIWTSYPKIEWVKSTSESIKSYSDLLSSLIDGYKDPNIIIGHMIDVAKKFNENKDIWASYPSSEWVKRTSESIKLYAELGSFINKNEFKDPSSIIDYMIGVAKKFKDNKNIWNNYPSLEWVNSTSDSILLYSGIISFIKDNNFEDISNVVDYMVNVAEKFKKNKDIWSSYPKIEWVNATSESIKLYAELGSFINNNVFKDPSTIIDYMVNVAKKFNDNKNTWNSYPKIEWVNATSESIRSYAELGSFISGIEHKDPYMIIDYMVNTAKKFNDNKDAWANYPPVKWITATSESIRSYAELGSFISGIEHKDPSMIIDYMVNTAKKFNENKDIWSSYPKIEWVNATSESIKLYAELGSFINNNAFKDPSTIIDYMVNMAKKFDDNKDIWKNYPPVEWSDGVLKSIESITKSISMLSSTDGDFKLLYDAAYSMLGFAGIVSKLKENGDIFKKGGTLDNFTTSIKSLSENLPSSSDAENLKTFANALNEISTNGITTSSSILALSNSVRDFSESLKNLDTTALTNLSKFSNGVLVLSLIDDKKLEDTLRVLDSKKNEIKSILSDNEMAKTRQTETKETKVEAVVAPKQPEPVAMLNDMNRDEFYDSILKYVSKLNDNVDKMANNEEEDGPKAGKTEEVK